MPDESPRRSVQFNNFDDVLADAAAIEASSDPKQLKGWTPGENIDHVAKLIWFCVQGYPKDAIPPLPMRLLGPLFKKGTLANGFKPNLPLPKKLAVAFAPRSGVTVASAVSNLRDGIAAFRARGPIDRNPMLGKMTPEQWEQLHCRHAELHFSFIEP